MQALVGGRLCGCRADALRLVGCNTLADAGPDEVAFLANRKYRRQLAASRAGLLLVAEGERGLPQRPLLRVADPYLAFARLQRHFHPVPPTRGARHPGALIDDTARLAEDVDVGPGCIIAAGVTIGAGSRLDAGVIVEEGAAIGAGCHLHSGVVVARGCLLGDGVVLQAGAVIGSDGFGYAWDGRDHLKIPQVGRVVLEDGVEVGANSCIDRGAIGDTVIGAGSKIDNLVQIGHNVTIGARSIIVSQVGISGSTHIGRGCRIGGQVGIAGHLTIGDGASLAAKSGVIGDVPAGATYAGLPAMPHRAWRKLNALLRRLARRGRGGETTQE
ncbi:MAG: UDP-3-O-(3-hydroxymyristoyl)glucosamine N-acyltransferase [Zetaproteobacteria bacterium]|nr:MAG: UDP-3-O-(3-hydroxymyristoyl)glucosamine N-acyltransferase [Zetaproteobacteria bacterium]